MSFDAEAHSRKLVEDMKTIQAIREPRPWVPTDAPPDGMALLFKPDPDRGGFTGTVHLAVGEPLTPEQRQALH